MIFPSQYQAAQTFTYTSSTDTVYTKYGRNIEVNKEGNPHQWLIEFRTRPNLTHSEMRGLGAFLNSLEGRYNTFQIVSPLPWLSPTTAPNVRAVAIAGASVIQLQNSPLSTVGAMKAGELFKFDNHDKVYEVQEDADSTASGFTDIKITPNLFEDVTFGVNLVKAVFTCRLVNDDNSVSLNAERIRDGMLITAEENV